VAQCRARPGDSLLHRLIRAQDVDGSLDEDELLANVMLLFIAGHETTTNLLGNGLLALLQDPDTCARLRADESLLDTAVEEMLRYDGPANVVARIARAPWTVGGVTIPAGALIYCLTGAANHDPTVFAHPARFDVARSPNPHLSFGGGVHFCLGAPLARLEAKIALAKLLARLPRLRLEGGEPPPWRALVNLRGLERLPLRAD
jgi:cytochrome P450